MEGFVVDQVSKTYMDETSGHSKSSIMWLSPGPLEKILRFLGRAAAEKALWLDF